MENKFILSLVCLLLICFGSQAQMITNQNTLTPTQLVNTVLVGQGVVASNIKWNGSATNANSVQPSALKFTATTAFPFSQGVYLRTQNGTSVSSDPDLNAIATNTVRNGSILEFDFIATGDTLSFNYMFASAEYPDYVCSEFNDVFGFFISGPGISGPFSNNSMNIARIPQTNVPVAINTVNSGVPGEILPGEYYPESNCAAQDPNWVSNSQYFTTQYGNYSGQGYRGGTISLPAGATLICGETYHIKLAVCNVGDQLLNSGVYLEGGSFSSHPVDFNFNTYTLDNVIYEGCNQLGTLVFTRSGCNDANESLVAYTSFSGQSQNGVDYELLGDSVYFAPGEDSVVWQIIPFEDGLTEGIESIDITIMSILINGDTVYSYGTFYISDMPAITLTAPDVAFQCLRDEAQITASATGGFPPFTYLWDHGPTTSSTTVPLNGNGVYGYKVTATDVCGYTKSDSVYVTMNQTLVIDSMQQHPATACLPTGSVAGFASGFTGTPLYNWSGPGANSQNDVDASVFQNLSPGWYYFSVTDNVCAVNDSILLGQTQAPVASFTADHVVGCSPLTVNFTNTSQNASNFQWSFGNGLSSNVSNMSNQSSTFTQSATVRLIASAAGCSDTMTLAISISICGCTDPNAINYNGAAQVDDGSCTFPIPAVEIPNVFTPDGDNANNLYFLNTTNALNIEMWIYNRWGNEMYHGSGLNPAWDGKTNGTEAQDGVYFMRYIVKGYNSSLEGHGFLHLIRK